MTPLMFAALTALALSAISPAARADGLSDLKASLARLQSSSALVRAALDIQTLERRGSGKDLDERIGHAKAAIDADARGLRLTLPAETLGRMDDESRAQGRDSHVKTPTLWALARLDAAACLPLVSAAAALERAIDESTYAGEKPQDRDGRPARLLTFVVPVTVVPEQQRKYVRSFEGSLSIWIAADGTPLASVLRQSGRGRAFVIIGFEASSDEEDVYGVVNDRLLTLHKDVHIVSAGAGERGEQRVVTALRLQP